MLQFLTESLLLYKVVEAVGLYIYMAHAGRFVPAGPMSHNEITLLSLPVATGFPPMKIFAHVFVKFVKSTTDEPKILHLVITLFVASFLKVIVEVPEVEERVVLV